MSKLCPYCLTNYDEIYNVAYDQSTMDIAFAHMAPSDIASAVGVPREQLMSFCGVKDMDRPGTKILIRPELKSIHVMRNTKNQGDRK